METSDARISGFKGVICAPRRFLPRTRSRTGLIVCFAHHEDGSTFVTDGVCPYADEQKPATKRHKRRKENRLCFLCLFVAVISLSVCGALSYRPQRQPAAAVNSRRPSLASAASPHAGSLRPSASISNTRGRVDSALPDLLRLIQFHESAAARPRHTSSTSPAIARDRDT